MVTQSVKLKLNNVGERCSDFFYGKAFPIQIGLIATLCYVAEEALFALFIFSLLASFIFLFYKNLAPIFPLLFLVVTCFRSYDVFNEITPYIILIPAGISLVAHFFLHPIKWQRPGRLFYALIFVTLAYALAGITKEDYELSYGIAYLLSLGPVMIIIYLLFSNSLPVKKDFCAKKYLCYSLLVTGLVMGVQIAYLRFILLDANWAETGWANANGCATYLLLSIPACYYLMIKSRILFPYFICLFLLYFSLIITGSDAALGFCILYSPIMLLYTYRHIYRTKRKTFTYTAMLVTVVVAGTVIILVSKLGFNGMIELFRVDPSDSGRQSLYEKAIELFKENPIFGYGFKYDDGRLETSRIRLFNFHSTLLHVMATMGIFGVLCYAFYFAVRFKILMQKYTPFTMLMLVAFIMVESYGMIDTAEFNAIPLMSSVTVMLTVAELATKKETLSHVLPLTTNKRNGYYF